jgi:hypothetical protein
MWILIYESNIVKGEKSSLDLHELLSYIKHIPICDKYTIEFIVKYKKKGK